MKPVIAALVFGSIVLAASAENPKVPRPKMASVELMVNTQLAALVPEEPYFLIGLARGAYLDGIGAVFSAEINLATGPSLSPFKQTISKEEIQKHLEKKNSRMPLLRSRMISIISGMASYLETMPNNEEFIFAVTLLRYPWEVADGIPSQVVLRVRRDQLLNAQRTNARVDSVIRLQEY